MGGKRAKRGFFFPHQKFVKENGKEQDADRKTLRFIVWFPALSTALPFAFPLLAFVWSDSALAISSYSRFLLPS